MDIDAMPQAFAMVILAPLYLSLRKEFVLDVLPIGMPREINVSFFSIQPGVVMTPVVELITCGVNLSSGFVLAVTPKGRISLLAAFSSILVAEQNVLICS
eukprot:1051242-Pleurochrysis_carterae.AAC.1